MKIAIVFFAIVGASLAVEVSRWWQTPQKRIEVDPVGIDYPLKGKKIDVERIPYQVLLFINDLHSSWTCGGAVLSKTHLITSASCVKGAVFVEVLLRATDLRNITCSEQSAIISTKVEIHDDFNEDNLVNDIALVEFSRVDDDYFPVGRVSEDIWLDEPTNEYEGANVQVNGWGKVDGNESPVALLSYNSTILSPEKCKSVYSKPFSNATQICISGDTGISICDIDAGGPLISGHAIVGITSYGASQCRSGLPIIFTRITPFKEWMEWNSDLYF